MRDWFHQSESHLFEEIIRGRIVSAQIDALDAAQAAGRFPKFQDKTEALLAEAAFWREFLNRFQELSTLEGLTLSQPTLKPITQHA